MDRNNRPVRREKRISGSSGTVGRRPGSGNSRTESSRANSRRAGSSIGSALAGMVVQEAVAEATGKRKSKKLLVIVAIVVVLALATGNMGTLMSLLGLGSGISDSHSLMNGYTGSTSGNSGWTIMNGAADSEGILNTAVSEKARDKYTTIKGNGRDEITTMIYLCGTDLESRNGMATSDLKEMINADISDKMNVLVFTGGCADWKNTTVSNRKNQIYQITSRGLKLLAETGKSASMTDPDTLASFIKWGRKNFPADRYNLILWDHGGGSISGYGYDELNRSSGSMTLDKIGKALKDGGCRFDFVGFDACLMATLETALIVEPYADYLIASEETEPGVGWYYTNWLSELSADTSKPTVEVGKTIVDDFIKMCGKQAAGQQTTLSVTDLSELSGTLPASFKSFANSTCSMIKEGNHKQVSTARGNSKEFAKQNAIDQVDIVDFAKRLDTKESKALAKAISEAVKYNRTSANVSNAYGLSIYFPYVKSSNVSKMDKTYEKIGMDKEYRNCIRSFASMQTGGQTLAGGASGQMNSLFGSLIGSALSGSGVTSSSSLPAAQLIGALLEGRNLDNVGLNKKSAQFIDEETLKENETYLQENSVDTLQLYWQNINGRNAMQLSEEQWELIQNVELNVFVDDGEGYIDLGLDNVYEFDDDGNLIGEFDKTWMAINNQFVAYYMTSVSGNQDDYTIMGRVPAKLNGKRVNLILSFTDENPYGDVLGAQLVYKDSVTETEAKGLIEIEQGDRIDFICDYYDYDQNYVDSYELGKQLKVKGNLVVTNKPIDNTDYIAAYRITDIYQNHFWTPCL